MDLDEDLSNTPTITKIELDTKNNALIYLDFSYSDSCGIELQRREVNAFENISFNEQSRTVLVDTLFDKEASHNFAYRVRVTKGKYKSAYSKEKALDYSFANLNLPEHFTARSLELQGVELSWSDRSQHEDGYIIEKDKGSGYVRIADLPANRSSYMDTISGMPQPPLQLNYRLKAYNIGMSSLWSSINLAYSGIGSPTDLRVVFASSANFIIEWKDNSNIETGYVVERKKDDGAYEQATTLAENTERYIDKMNELGMYSYRVRAQKDNYFSSYSSEVEYEIKELIPTEGLVAYYPFNGNANDESGNGNNGTINNAVLSTDRFNIDNKCFLFSGANSYITASSTVLPNKDRTVSLWFYSENLANNPIVLGYGGGTCGTSFFMNVNYSNKYYLVSSHCGVKTIASQSESVPTGKWHNYVFTTNSAGSKIYRDMLSVGSNSVYFDNTNTSGKNFYLGVAVNAAGTAPFTNVDCGYFNGKLDDIRIFNRALSENEIKQLYYEGGWGN